MINPGDKTVTHDEPALMTTHQLCAGCRCRAHVRNTYATCQRAFRRLLAGCWTHEPIWTGTTMTCQTCGTVIEVLPQETVRGPKHDPDPVRGAPLLRAKTVRVGNVRAWKRSER